MTPREGVEAKCPNYDGHLDRMVRDGRLGFSDIIHFAEGAWGDGYLAGRAAHPAATAREEAFYEAALAYFESDKARMAAFTGEVFIEGPESAAIAEAGKRLGAARAAYAALALARSVKETEV